MIGTLLERQGWRLEVLGLTRYRYRKDSYHFEVEYADDARIFVTVPLPGSDSRYRTRLDSADDADEYLAMHLDHLEKIESHADESDEED